MTGTGHPHLRHARPAPTLTVLPWSSRPTPSASLSLPPPWWPPPQEASRQAWQPSQARAPLRHCKGLSPPRRTPARGHPPTPECLCLSSQHPPPRPPRRPSTSHPHAALARCTANLLALRPRLSRRRPPTLQRLARPLAAAALAFSALQVPPRDHPLLLALLLLLLAPLLLAPLRRWPRPARGRPAPWRPRAPRRPTWLARRRRWPPRERPTLPGPRPRHRGPAAPAPRCPPAARLAALPLP